MRGDWPAPHVEGQVGQADDGGPTPLQQPAPAHLDQVLADAGGTGKRLDLDLDPPAYPWVALAKELG
jgi:hypothetical protein